MIKQRIYAGITIFGLFSFSAHCVEITPELSTSRKNTSVPQLPTLESIMPRKEFDQKIDTVKKSKRHLEKKKLKNAEKFSMHMILSLKKTWSLAPILTNVNIDNNIYL